jgi:uncharacterized protein YjeT (DUF2065 family)
VEDILRPVGFVAIVIGFVLVALGVATSMHALPPAQFPDRWLALVGGIFMLVGIGLTALAGRSVKPSVIAPTAPQVKPPLATFSIKITKSTKTVGSEPGGLIPTALSRLVDVSSKAMIAGMLADLDDPSKASTIHIEGADPAQVKEELRKLLSSDNTVQADLKAGSSTADSPPETSIDARSSQLRELDDLHATGVLSDEQYQAARAKLLG